MRFFKTESELSSWDRVLRGDMAAYQDVVESHQSAVSAVAFAIIGDFPISQDIAQETFWVAWTERGSLRDPRKLSSWLCGIARNLAKQWCKKHRKLGKPIDLELAFDPAANDADPIAQSIADEERQMVWASLELMPEQFREVLTLYYQQDQSIAEVAAALDMSVDAARQRLTRGRTMLKGQVARLVEGVLSNSKPDKSFAAKVIGGLAAASMASKAGTAAASTASVAKTVGGTSASVAVAKNILTTGVATGGVVGGTMGSNVGGPGGAFVGGVLGGMVGLFGGYLGIWVPAQLAATETERQLILQHGRTILITTIAFMVATILISLSHALLPISAVHYVALHIVLNALFLVALLVQILRLIRQQFALRNSIDARSDPNQSPIARFGRKLVRLGWSTNVRTTVRRGRRFTSKVVWFGFPLIDIQFSDGDFGGNRIDKTTRLCARGWIAFGDQATGILFAYGGIARGLVAIGGLAIGGISVGGISLGVISLGGLTFGTWAIGGAAIGNDSSGYVAMGWHSAAGGVVAAWDYAVGTIAFAREANSPVAEQVVNTESLGVWVQECRQNPALVPIGITIFVLLHAVFMLQFVFCSKEDTG